MQRHIEARHTRCSVSCACTVASCWLDMIHVRTTYQEWTGQEHPRSRSQVMQRQLVSNDNVFGNDNIKVSPMSCMAVEVSELPRPLACLGSCYKLHGGTKASAECSSGSFCTEQSPGVELWGQSPGDLPRLQQYYALIRDKCSDATRRAPHTHQRSTLARRFVERSARKQDGIVHTATAVSASRCLNCHSGVSVEKLPLKYATCASEDQKSMGLASTAEATDEAGKGTPVWTTDP